MPAGSTVPDASAGAPAGASVPVTPETSTPRSAQVQAQIVAPNTPTQVAPSQSIAAQIAGIAAEEKPQIKVTTDAQNGTPKSLTSPGLLALANTQNNSPGTNTGSANRGLTNGGATGGNATSADVLLNAQVAAEKEIFGAVVSATAAKIPAGASPMATSATTSSAEVLPTAGTGFANSGAQPTSQIATAPAAKAGTPTPSAAEQVGIHLTRAAQSGATRFTIQLHPAELGRVDVKMEVTHDGKIHAVVTADRQDTLDMLQRDARGLERALQSSGLKADSNSLSFSLRDQGGSSGTFAESGNSRPGAPLLENDEMTTPADIAALANQASGLGDADGRLNILV
ncbi:MAG: flagellar hook-length control protein FliK [Rhodospirillales bacterium]|nr:flagellar hook-length control protein FliK [Rhodospirillales bacterium]